METNINSSHYFLWLLKIITIIFAYDLTFLFTGQTRFKNSSVIIMQYNSLVSYCVILSQSIMAMSLILIGI